MKNMCYFCEEKFENKYLKDKKYGKVKDHFHYTEKYAHCLFRCCA